MALGELSLLKARCATSLAQSDDDIHKRLITVNAQAAVDRLTSCIKWSIALKEARDILKRRLELRRGLCLLDARLSLRHALDLQ